MNTYLPEEIVYLLDNYDADDSSLSIQKVDFSSVNPTFDLILNQQNTAPQLWRLEVHGYRDSQLSLGDSVDDTSIFFADDHPLLWKYSDEQCELYFNGSSKDSAELISELIQIDLDLFGACQKSVGRLNLLLQSTYGNLCMGPKELLTRYAACLNKYDIKTSLIGGHMPTYSDGKGRFNGEILKVLYLRGSYIVGRDFFFTKDL